jgi:hypothetical protein
VKRSLVTIGSRDALGIKNQLAERRSGNATTGFISDLLPQIEEVREMPPAMADRAFTTAVALRR